MTEKYCSLCKLVKPLAAFSADKRGKFGRHGWCKICKKSRERAFFAKNPAVYEKYRAARKASNRRYELKRHYGLSLADVEQMRIKQNSACLLCYKICSSLVIDHDHATGKVRGLLCSACNISLGHYEKIKSAAEIYLAENADIKRVSISLS